MGIGDTYYNETKADNFKNLFKSNLINNETDQISQLFNSLVTKKLAMNLITIKYKNEIIGKKIIRDECLLPNNMNYIFENWEKGFRGTKYANLEPIMRRGLLIPKVQIPFTSSKFSNFINAIFVSPSIFYAGNECFSDRINSSGVRYSVLIEVRVKPGCYTSHNSTVLKHVKVDGEPSKVEYRIEVKDNSNIIMRVANQSNVIVTGILFAKTEFLENIKSYYEGNIYVNSDEERKLF